VKRSWAVSRVICWLILVVFMTWFLALPVTFAQDSSASTTFTSQDWFDIPAYNSSIGFAVGGSYANASLQNNTWDFTGLVLEGGKTAVPLPMVNGFALSISAHDSNIKVTRFDPLNVFPPQGSGWLEYTAQGVGNQTLNLHYYYNQWLNYSVYIDGVAKPQNNGWFVTDEGWITVTGATASVKISYGGRSPTVFTSADRFAIPALNSSINFEGSGTYIYANLENNTWTFQNLALNGNVPQGAPHWALGVSAQDCDVMITYFVAPFGITSIGWLNYTVIGVGVQAFNSNLDEVVSFPLNYTVYVDGIEKPKNENWIVSGDDWLTITGASSNVSVAFIQNVPDSFKNAPPPIGPVGPLAQYGSEFVIIALIIVVMSVVLVKVFRQKKQTDHT
jgi:hypothetical protein